MSGEPRKLCVNYADLRFLQSQIKNSESALATGGFTDVRSFGRSDLDPDFVAANEEVLARPQGAGTWIWKPYIIRRGLEMLDDGDYLFYCDSGSNFIAPIDYYCESMEDDILVFDVQLPESDWTKRDCFVLMGCDTDEYTNSSQRLGGFVLLRKCARSVGFIDQWLELVQDPRLILDTENVCGLPNYPGFNSHRHDQSVMSLLSKKMDVQHMINPSQNGNKRRPESQPQLVFLHRNPR